MQLRFAIFLFILFASCNQNDSSEAENKTDTITVKPDTNPAVDANKKAVSIADSAVYAQKLLDLSTTILKLIKDRNYTGLSKFIHPASGVRFSAYAYIDTAMDKIFSQKTLIALSKSQQKIKWGPDDESGKPMIYSINDYFKRFVYDVDFLNAEKKTVNKFLGYGNSLNNLKEIYPECDFTEFYFSGFDPKYEGMDWRTLRLVFKKHEGKLFLAGIVHDEWTI